MLLKVFSGFIGEVPPLHFGFFFTATIVPVLSYFLFKPLAGKLFAKHPCTFGVFIVSLVWPAVVAIFLVMIATRLGARAMRGAPMTALFLIPSYVLTILVVLRYYNPDARPTISHSKPHPRTPAPRPTLAPVLAATLAIVCVPIFYLVVGIFIRTITPLLPVGFHFAATSAVTAALAYTGTRMYFRNTFSKYRFNLTPVVLTASVAGTVCTIGGLALGMTQDTYSLIAPWAAVALGTWRGAHSVIHHLALRRGVGNACAHCSYDLSGLPDRTPCPECGGVYRYTTSITAPTTP
ncbi:MAG TPA: hypothetical protein VHN77_04015 [Phycisphaerales bacterium]|nr:hypothetical protein [Phycisphaerales bacterium]